MSAKFPRGGGAHPFSAIRLNVQQNIKQLQTRTVGVTINNKSTTTEPPPSLANGGGGGLNVFNWYKIFALDSTVVGVQEMLSSHGSTLTIAMYYH